MSQRYRPGSSQVAGTVITFRQQMADYARAELLRRLREEKHKSREDAAYEIGVSIKTLYNWEHGGKIKWPNAKKAGAYYEIDPEELVTREDGELPAEGTPRETQLDRIEDKIDQLLSAIQPAAAPARRPAKPRGPRLPRTDRQPTEEAPSEPPSAPATKR